jgi:dinuclear metal center YbgI/SA1388 family protein
MAPLSEIIAELDQLLEIEAFDDYGPNGLQVQGCPEVTHVATSVSSSLEVFEQAIAAGAQLIVVHHGLLWRADDLAVVGVRRDRLRALLRADVSLAAYHLPLDAHPRVGNNALLAFGLGLLEPAPFGISHGRAIGNRASVPGDGIPVAELVGRVASLTGREPLVFAGGPPLIRSVGIISGGAAGMVEEAIAAGLDAFITGEPSEPSRALAHDGGIHFIAAGHYATETFGVRALGEHLRARFAVEITDIPIENPV